MIPFKLYREPWPRIIGIPLIGILLAIIYSDGHWTFWHSIKPMVFTGLMWNLDYYLISLSRKKWPGVEQTSKRITRIILWILVANSTLDIGLCQLLSYFGLEEPVSLDMLSNKLATNLLVTFVVGSLYESGYFFRQWKEQTLIAEKAMSLQLQSELSSLKSQISPHFLFNSLNTLVSIIPEDPKKAVEFTERLSQVYRYILQYKEQESVPLETELHFAQAYYFLMKMRFENSLEMVFDIKEHHNHLFIAPLSLQILIENAIKHNVVSNSKPLKIEISTTNGDRLLVRNNFQLRKSVESYTGTGLNNIIKRYAYLVPEKEVEIVNDTIFFTVSLPLLTHKNSSKEFAL